MNETEMVMAAPATTLVSPLRQSADLLARFFKGIDDPTRVLILLLLLNGEKNVSELVELTGNAQGRVSTHLGCLRWCGYVSTRREGRSIYYRLADHRIRALLRIGEELMAEHALELLSCRVLAGEGDHAQDEVPR
jgi:DNA-binding transcriptional ArsR family regulator